MQGTPIDLITDKEAVEFVQDISWKKACPTASCQISYTCLGMVEIQSRDYLETFQYLFTIWKGWRTNYKILKTWHSQREHSSFTKQPTIRKNTDNILAHVSWSSPVWERTRDTEILSTCRKLDKMQVKTNKKDTIRSHLNKCSHFIRLNLIQPQVTQLDSSISVQRSFPVLFVTWSLMIASLTFLYSASCSRDHFRHPVHLMAIQRMLHS